MSRQALTLTLAPAGGGLQLVVRAGAGGCLRLDFAPVLRGEPGPPGASGSEALQLPAAVALSGHRVIAQDGDGLAIYADGANLSALAALGFSEHAVAPGGLVTVRQFGALSWPAGGLTPGAPLFLAAAGAVSHLPPATGYVRQVAVALSANRIQVGIGPAFDQE
jgi:hypothetical protein